MSEGTTSSGAAREGDEIGHDFGLAGMVAGALIGAAIGAAIVTAGVATGGVAIAAIVGGAIAMGGLSGGSLAHGLQDVVGAVNPTTGVLTAGSVSVFVNGRRAQRAGVDGVASCNGLWEFNHWSKRVKIAQGSSTVFVNGAPMARESDKMECGATISIGSANVIVGGPTATVLEIDDAEEAFKTALEVLGLVSLGAAGIAAFAAGGLTALLGFGSVVLLTGEGMSELKSFGDSLGPGWGDIFTGVAGFALLGLGARFSQRGEPTSGKPTEPGGMPGRPTASPSSARDQIAKVFDKSDPTDALMIDGQRVLATPPGTPGGSNRSGTTKVFESQNLTDAQIRGFAEELSGDAALVKKADGIYVADMGNGQTVTLRSVSSSQGQTQARWTIDVRGDPTLSQVNPGPSRFELKFR
jgi:uncharacterized Zn-binding protein involved in type VI secretion